MRAMAIAGSAMVLAATGCDAVVGEGADCGGKCDGQQGRKATIVNGQLDHGHPSVGVLDGSCTATLIGARTVLTAAHCIQSATASFVVGGATYTGAAHKYPAYNDQSIGDDVAVVLLSQAPNVAPSPILDSPPRVGQQVIIVGFGAMSEDGGEFGTKRVARNAISTVTAKEIAFVGASGAVGNHCYGDSGGPAFVDAGGAEVVAGVTSYGNGPCGIDGVDTRVDVYRDWIVTTAKGDVRLASQGTVAPAPTPTPTPAPVVPTGPRLQFVSPTNGATVGMRPTVELAVADGVAVHMVVVRPGLGSLSAPPYRFTLDLHEGPQLLEARVYETSGAVHEVSITVNVVAGSGSSPAPTTPAPAPATPSTAPAAPSDGSTPGPASSGGPGLLGDSCRVAADCSSAICAAAHGSPQGFCTTLCSDGCQVGMVCHASANPALSVCGLAPGQGSPAIAGEGINISGVGCSLGLGHGEPTSDAAVLLALLAACLLRRRR